MLLLPAHSPLAFGIILGIDTFFRSSIVSLLDTWILTSVSQDESISYGSLRLWGSVGFALTVLAYGVITEGRSVVVLFPLYLVLALATILICGFVKYGGSAPIRRVGLKELKPRKLFSSYYYIVFIAFVFLISTPNTPAGTFLPNLFEQAGGTMEQYGLMHSLKAFLEIPFFLFGRQLLKKFGCVGLLIAASCLYALQQFLFALAGDPLQVMLAQMLQGPAYSLFLLGMLHYVFELAPDDLKATAQTMTSAIGGGLSSIVGNYGGGLFIAYFGLRPIYWTGAISDIIVITLFLLSFALGKRISRRKGN